MSRRRGMLLLPADHLARLLRLKPGLEIDMLWGPQDQRALRLILSADAESGLLYEEIPGSPLQSLPIDEVQEPPSPSLLMGDSQGWIAERDPGTVPCHSRVIGGVLCRWWGDTPPPGVARLDTLETPERGAR